MKFTVTEKYDPQFGAGFGKKGGRLGEGTLKMAGGQRRLFVLYKLVPQILRLRRGFQDFSTRLNIEKTFESRLETRKCRRDDRKDSKNTEKKHLRTAKNIMGKHFGNIGEMWDELM